VTIVIQKGLYAIPEGVVPANVVNEIGMAGLDCGAGEFVSTFHQYNDFGLAISKKGIHTVISLCGVFEIMNGLVFVIHDHTNMWIAIGIIPDGLARDQRRRLIHPMDNDLR
jgi:hypothetical protein